MKNGASQVGSLNNSPRCVVGCFVCSDWSWSRSSIGYSLTVCLSACRNVFTLLVGLLSKSKIYLAVGSSHFVLMMCIKYV